MIDCTELFTLSGNVLIQWSVSIPVVIFMSFSFLRPVFYANPSPLQKLAPANTAEGLPCRGDPSLWIGDLLILRPL